jgi:2-iminobutanoate/2-iminopropanoate deaminase
MSHTQHHATRENQHAKGISQVYSPQAPEPVGPYSQAVLAGDYVFVSGQIPLDHKTSAVASGEISQQTELVMRNTEKILEACGLSLADVVKADVFLKDLADFSAMNEVYARMFPGDVKPARCVVQAAKLPKDVKIELSCTAYNGGAKAK